MLGRVDVKAIVIGEQPRLGFLRTLRITVDGIRYRLFRALVTVAVIAVAVAFLMNILSEGIIKRAVAANTRERIALNREVHRWSARLTTPTDRDTLLALLATAEDGDPLLEDARQFGGLTPGELAALRTAAAEARVYGETIERMNYAYRRRILRGATGAAAFDTLASPDGWSVFIDGVREITGVRLPFPASDLEAFAATWPAVREKLVRIRAGQADAIATLRAMRRERPIMEALADADGAFGEAIRAAGFHLDASQAPHLAAQAQREIDLRFVERSIDLRTPRQTVARAYDILPGDVTLPRLWRYLADRTNAARYLDALAEEDARPDHFSVARLQELSAFRREAALLERAERRTADMGEGWMGLGARMGWLLLVSMLVCGIGIANAMLMAVTERFREIATLKCLGSLDGFILLMFVMESCILGLIGGLAGGLIGALIGTGRMLVAFGAVAVPALSLGALTQGFLASLIVGIILAALAAVYPSFRAARLAPMEAMRVE